MAGKLTSSLSCFSLSSYSLSSSSSSWLSSLHPLRARSPLSFPMSSRRCRLHPLQGPRMLPFSCRISSPPSSASASASPQVPVALQNEEEEEDGEAVITGFSLLHGGARFLQEKLPPPRALVALGSGSFVEKLLLPPFSFDPSSVLFVHSSLETLADAKAEHEDLRCLHFETEEAEAIEEEDGSSLMELPESCCPFQLAFLNDFSSLRSWPRRFLPQIFSLCSAGAMVFISCRSGKSQHDTPLKSLADFERLLSDFPLEVTAIKEESGLFLAALKVKDQLNKGANETASDLVPSKGHFPLRVKGVVVHGFGRGSKQLGFPTANLAVEKLPRDVIELQNGVYYGWAQVIGINNKPEVHEMVMNVGLRPTFGDADSMTLEVHILHNYSVDFHGKELRLVILGFIRDELKLKSLVPTLWKHSRKHCLSNRAREDYPLVSLESATLAMLNLELENRDT